MRNVTEVPQRGRRHWGRDYDVVTFSIDEQNKAQFLGGGCELEGASDWENLRREIAVSKLRHD